MSPKAQQLAGTSRKVGASRFTAECREGRQAPRLFYSGEKMKTRNDGISWTHDTQNFWLGSSVVRLFSRRAISAEHGSNFCWECQQLGNTKEAA